MEHALGQRTKDVRMMRGLTQYQMAQMMDTAQSHVCAVELGRARPSLRFLTRMARALVMTVDELLGVVAYEPRKPGPGPSIPTSKPSGSELHDAFVKVPEAQATASLQVAYRRAQDTALGRQRLVAVHARSRNPRKFWNGVKLLAEGQDGHQQSLTLALLERGTLREIAPASCGLPNAVVSEPGRPWLAVVVAVKSGFLLFYPRLAVALRGEYHTLDFMVAASIDGHRAYFDLAVDLSEQTWHMTRADVLGLTPISVSEWEIDQPGVVDTLVERIRAEIPASRQAA
ncbi:MAG: helix-turn-helix transcriptional regulator [Armatimonadetes bacterium]|nr:helix-turn-helix transcriptional regulator [Armatimonadota bacterium]